MLTQRSLRSTFRIAAVLSVLAFVASCDSDSTGPEEEEPSVATMELTFGSTVRTITGSATENRSVTLARGATTVTARWLRADGTVDPIAVAGTFKLDVRVPSGTTITWTPSATNLYSGTINISGPANSVPVEFGLLHIAEDHVDFGRFAVNITAP